MFHLYMLGQEHSRDTTFVYFGAVTKSMVEAVTATLNIVVDRSRK